MRLPFVHIASECMLGALYNTNIKVPRYTKPNHHRLFYILRHEFTMFGVWTV